MTQVERAPVRDRRTVVRAAAVVVALLAGIVVPLALLVVARWSPLVAFDRTVTTDLHGGSLGHEWLEDVAQVVTVAGTSWFRYIVLIPVAGWLLARRGWRATAFVAVSALAIAPITSGLKELVGRVRPNVENPGEVLRSLSFPSGHSSGVATLVCVLLVLAWPVCSRAGRICAAAAGAAVVLAVTATRLLLGVHYVSDVVAGTALGVGWVLLVGLLAGVVGRDRPERNTSSSPGA